MAFDDFYLNLGKKIKFLREVANLTQEQLAEKAGISLDYLGKIEVNISKPGLRTVLKLSKALDLKPYQLMFFD
jgi:transcriptional regulator with XRE-family HTH domain